MIGPALTEIPRIECVIYNLVQLSGIKYSMWHATEDMFAQDRGEFERILAGNSGLAPVKRSIGNGYFFVKRHESRIPAGISASREGVHVVLCDWSAFRTGAKKIPVLELQKYDPKEDRAYLLLTDSDPDSELVKSIYNEVAHFTRGVMDLVYQGPCGVDLEKKVETVIETIVGTPSFKGIERKL